VLHQRIQDVRLADGDELVAFGGPTRSTKTAKEFLGSGNLEEEVTWGDNLKTKLVSEVNFEEWECKRLQLTAFGGVPGCMLDTKDFIVALAVK